MGDLDIHMMYLTEKEKEVLNLIIDNNNISQIEISKKLNSTEGYVSKIIHKMAKNGIINKDYITKKFIINLELNINPQILIRDLAIKQLEKEKKHFNNNIKIFLKEIDVDDELERDDELIDRFKELFI